jgi:hypothetical protein
VGDKAVDKMEQEYRPQGWSSTDGAVTTWYVLAVYPANDYSICCRTRSAGVPLTVVAEISDVVRGLR